MAGINAGAMRHQLLPPMPSVYIVQESMNNVLTPTAKKRILAKQLSMRETSREAKWEKRRRQILHQRRVEKTAEDNEGSVNKRRDYRLANDVVKDCEEFDQQSGNEGANRASTRKLTDEDLDELKGSIELGFGFNEDKGGHNLCNTLPALDLYFAVNRQFSDPKLFSPSSSLSSSSFFSCPSPQSPNEQFSGPSESWKICSPGDKPQDVKARLRHWAQAVACSVRQSC